MCSISQPPGSELCGSSLTCSNFKKKKKQVGTDKLLTPLDIIGNIGNISDCNCTRLAFTVHIYFAWTHSLLTICSSAFNCLLTANVDTCETHQGHDHLIWEEVGKPCCSADESLLAEKCGGGTQLPFCALLPQHGQSTAG